MLKTKVSSSYAGRPVWQAQVCIPTVSVIIVNYNGRSYLDACLQSVLAYSGKDVEVFLVDNQSDDGSADYVSAHYPQVQVIPNQNNGYGAGNNLAARVALGKYLVFLNPDTCVTPGWLDRLLLPLAANPRIGMTTPKLVLMDDPQRINTAGNDVHLTGLTLCRGMGEPVEGMAETAVIPAVSGAAFVMRHDLFSQLGGFDADFFLYMEDTDLSLRARFAGYSCLYVPKSVVYHDYSLRFGSNKTYYQERNRYLMLLKNLRWRTLLLLLPALLLAELITWGFVLVQEPARLVNKLRAYAWIGRRWQSIMRKRRKTQAKRCISDLEWLAGTTTTLSFEQAGSGVSVRMAHGVFDPLFTMWLRLLQRVVRW